MSRQTKYENKLSRERERGIPSWQKMNQQLKYIKVEKFVEEINHGESTQNRYI